MNKTSHVLNLIAPEDGGAKADAEPKKESARQGDLGELIAGQLQSEFEKTQVSIKKETAAAVSDKKSDNALEISDDINIKGEEKKMDKLILPEQNDGSEDYVAVNIVEDLVKSKAKAFVTKFGICDCHRCVSDVIALALNDLPSRYTVTHKGMLFSKIASYENQYSADINHALTKACMLVNESPRH